MLGEFKDHVPYLIHFEELRDQTAGSISGRLPVVIFKEHSEHPEFTRAFRHADFMSVYVARKGRGKHLIEGVPFEVREGDVYGMGLGMAHHFDDAEQLVLDTVHFMPTMFSSKTLEALADTEGLTPLFLGNGGAEVSRWMRLSPANHVQVGEIFRDMGQEWEVDSPDRALMVQAALLRLLVFLARCHRSAHRTGSSLALRASSLIERRYAEPLKIADLAASAFLSIDRFTEVFRSEIGCSPREYLGQVRIQAAKKLLRETDLSISAIAAHTGFPDPAYFTRFFRQQVGLSPSEFREETDATR